MKKTYVTKSFLPPFEEYVEQLRKIWDTNILTNQGPCLQEFEGKMKNFLEVENFHYLSNGTIALMLALSALDIGTEMDKDTEIITTPFSYVASVSPILWQKCKPVFVDINSDNFTIDADKIEKAITPKTKAILAVHVFGYACDVDKIQKIADKYNLKVIYDGAHAFGAKYQGKSLTAFGDITTISFHATKLFHTVEGGACIVKDKKISDKLELQKRFGHNTYNHLCLGINGKQSEFHAAMGLANFPHLSEIFQERKRISDRYTNSLLNLQKTVNLQRPKQHIDLELNYAYYPVVFESEEQLLSVLSALEKENIMPRRYFFPSLNTLSYLEEYQACPISEDISKRILCLPLFPELSNEEVDNIIKIINEILCL